MTKHPNNCRCCDVALWYEGALETLLSGLKQDKDFPGRLDFILAIEIELKEGKKIQEGGGKR